MQDQTPRSQWKLCRIDELIVGRDGVVRAVRIKCSNGNVLQRPIQHIYPLEIRDDHETIPLNKEADLNVLPSKVPGRSQRTAAVDARRKIQSNLDDP